MRHATHTVALLVLGCLVALPAAGQEKTGKRINELVRDLNKDLNQAREKVENLEKEQKAQQAEAPADILPRRKKALEKLQAASSELNEAEDPAKRQELSKEQNSP